MHVAPTIQPAYANLRPPPEVEIAFAEQLRQPQRAMKAMSSTTSSSSPASTLPRRTPKSPSSPSFLGTFGKGVFHYRKKISCLFIFQQLLFTIPQCGNFLRRRFYVKSILANLESQK